MISDSGPMGEKSVKVREGFVEKVGFWACSESEGMRDAERGDDDKAGLTSEWGT